jgi:hypothetical protein
VNFRKLVACGDGGTEARVGRKNVFLSLYKVRKIMHVKKGYKNESVKLNVNMQTSNRYKNHKISRMRVSDSKIRNLNAKVCDFAILHSPQIHILFFFLGNSIHTKTLIHTY